MLVMNKTNQHANIRLNYITINNNKIGAVPINQKIAAHKLLTFFLMCCFILHNKKKYSKNGLKV